MRSCLLATTVLALFLFASDAPASAQRTFVASYGIAGNTTFNCSIVKPCRAFSDALSVTNAGGELIVLDSAGYGPVTITQPVSIIAPTGIYAGISVFSDDGITVNAPGATVVLRGLTINGQGGASGVKVLQAARLRIESCVISGMSAAGVDHTAAGAEMIILDTIVRDNASTGISVIADASAVLDHVRVEHNGADGLFIQATTTDARAMITDSIFAFNGLNGMTASAQVAGRTYAQIERSVLADNGAAGLKVSTTGAGIFATVAMTRNSIHRNGAEQVIVTGGGGARAFLTENTLLYDGIGISVSGSNNDVAASANTLTPLKLVGHVEFAQAASATFTTYSNNISPTFNSSGTITPATGN
jgi:hypothetical protein